MTSTIQSNPHFRSITYHKDYSYGKKQQEIIIDILKDYFDSPNMKATPERYCKWDFEDDKNLYELKSRKNRKNQYPTTLLTCNKVISSDKQQIFVFNFTDQICYLKYDKHVFDTFERKPYSRINKEEDMTDYFFVPLEYLTTLKIK